MKMLNVSFCVYFDCHSSAYWLIFRKRYWWKWCKVHVHRERERQTNSQNESQSCSTAALLFNRASFYSHSCSGWNNPRTRFPATRIELPNWFDNTMACGMLNSINNKWLKLCDEKDENVLYWISCFEWEKKNEYICRRCMVCWH